jgi:hypothetical protein
VFARSIGLWWNTALVLMRSLAGQLLVPVLATLLVLTTPVGTGQGVHEHELLHPLLPHIHLIDGRIVSDEQMAAARSSATPNGPAFGAGSGADAPGLGTAMAPTLPVIGLILLAAPDGRLAASESAVPVEFRDAPEEPPPNPFA